ncbi:protein of unknown function DUF4378 [Dillenia turbinata]|uniref:DUF4378 domain-containing protein n=1 Tax=Dillenia turbinata TaxID=194707 RepID=A0AAN8ZSJ8_9MAGN
MMAQKCQLHQLLKEDQEPFLLKNYIADRQKSLPKIQIQPKKPKPISQNPNFPNNFCQNPCFFSSTTTDLTKSPLFSPAKSNQNNTIFLQIPARTATLLLEAALRVQKTEQKQNKNLRFGLIGSILKRLTNRKQSKSKGIDKKQSNEKLVEVVNVVKVVEKNRRSGRSHRRSSSAGWSESNEDNKSSSLDLESSSSCCGRSDSDHFASPEKRFCESPFRFNLQRSPSSRNRTPDSSSPAASPVSRKKEEKESSKKLFQAEEEEEKEQCSPVSVLDPPFNDVDDDEDHHENADDDMDNDEDVYDLECSYAIVQRTKQQLLQRLRRFEKLAELDPIELEKRMAEDDEDDAKNNYHEKEKEWEDYNEAQVEKKIEVFACEVLGKSSFRKIPVDLKRLVSDLIDEEGREPTCNNEDGVARRVCKRLESWKEVESNTIDMMVELDFRRGLDGWKKSDREQVGEIAMEIEVGLFGLLVEELSEELVCCGRH